MGQINALSTDVKVNRRNLIGIRLGDRLLLVAFLVAASVTALTVAALNRNSAANTTAAVTPASSVGGKAALARPQEKMRTERVTAFPYGFEPDEITRCGCAAKNVEI